MFGINILENSSNYIEKINLSNPTWDMFIFLLFITISFFYGIFIGRDKIIHLLLSSFFSFFIVKFNPFFSYIKGISSSELSMINLGLFIFFMIFLYVIFIKKSILSNIESYPSRILHVFVYSFLHSGLLISLSLNFLDEKILLNFGKTIYNIFINDIALFSWIFASILALIFIKGEKEE